MGTIVPRPQKDGTTRYRAQIRIKRGGQIVHNESQTFSKKPMAVAWLARREAELEKPGAIDASKHGGVSVGDVLQMYREEVVEGGAFGRTKLAHIRQLEGGPLAELSAVSITSIDLLAHIKQRRQGGAGPATVANDLIWLRIAFKYVRRARGIPLRPEVIDEATEAARSARMIGRAKRRDRRPTPDELEKLDAYFGKQTFRKDGSSPPMRLIMWFAIYSCRRQEEICSLRRADIDIDSRTIMVRDVKHPDGSAGNNRLALMTPRCLDLVGVILQDVRSGDGRLLPFNEKTVSANFTRACRVLGIDNLRFHDLRHEGCSRLAEDGATIPQIQQVSLHESWSSLQRYVNLPPVRARRVDFEDTKPRPSSLSLHQPRACRDTEPAR